jgi:hypothetical protein
MPDLPAQILRSHRRERALALCFGYFNFWRIHLTLETTLAVKSGRKDHPWSLQALLGAGGDC